MDEADKKILAELQNDGRLSLTDLAERVGLSVSPCHRRLRALEEQGAIKGYKAQIDPSFISLEFTAIVFVTLKSGDGASISDFENSLVDIPEIIQAQRLFNDPDYLLHVIVSDLKTFQKLYDEKLSNLPNVLRLNANIVMKDVIPLRNYLI